MTALPGRRRRSTLVAAIAAAAAVAVVITLTIIGALTLYNSTEGADASAATRRAGVPEHADRGDRRRRRRGQAGVDRRARRAAGRDRREHRHRAGQRRLRRRRRAATACRSTETLAVQGQDALPRRARGDAAPRRSTTSSSSTRPGSPSCWRRSAPLTSTCRSTSPTPTATSWPRPGRPTMDAAAAAAVLTARDPTVSAAEQYPAAGAVWSAVAQAVGAGIAAGSSDPTTASDRPPRADRRRPSAPASDAAVATPVRPADRRPRRAPGRCGSTPSPPDQNIGNVDVVARSTRPRLVLVFGQIAPGTVSAPGSGLSFRVVSAFSDDQLAATGLTNTEVAYARDRHDPGRRRQRPVGRHRRRDHPARRRRSRSPTQTLVPAPRRCRRAVRTDRRRPSTSSPIAGVDVVPSSAPTASTLSLTAPRCRGPGDDAPTCAGRPPRPTETTG